jgi:hypothetical protein
VRKYRRFADPKKGYGPEDLDELLGLCQKHGRALGFTKIGKFLVIRDKRERRKFQRQAIEQGWSLGETEAELFRRRGRRAKVGRRPKIPETTVELLVGLESWCLRWRRLHEDLAGKASAAGEPVRLADLSAGLRKWFVEAAEAIERLEGAVTSELKKTRPAAGEEAHGGRRQGRR